MLWNTGSIFLYYLQLHIQLPSLCGHANIVYNISIANIIYNILKINLKCMSRNCTLNTTSQHWHQLCFNVNCSEKLLTMYTMKLHSNVLKESPRKTFAKWSLLMLLGFVHSSSGKQSHALQKTVCVLNVLILPKGMLLWAFLRHLSYESSHPSPQWGKVFGSYKLGAKWTHLAGEFNEFNTSSICSQ